MRTRLLVAGVALVLLAVASENRWLAGRQARAEVATLDAIPTEKKSLTDRVVHSVSGAFDAVVADAVLTGVQNAEQVLRQYEPTMQVTYGEDGRKARAIASEVAKACKQARAELSKGKTSVALDYAVQASRDLDVLKKMFERR
ncbi:MAG: hypothetical protein ACRENP_17560 [Longimicrobiales bacterium]